MLSGERLEEIVRIVNQRGSITNQELVAMFNSSESTIRRDITALAAENRVIKIHGGAMTIKNNVSFEDYSVSKRRTMNAEEKNKIGAYAAGLIENNDLVYIDAGTTTEFLINHIQHTNAIFVTNAISHAQKLAEKGMDVYLVGGRLKPVTESIIGSGAILSLDKYNFTKGFFGTNGISIKRGMTTPDIKEAAVKEYALSRCSERYILGDSSKFDDVSAVTFATFEEVSIITEEIPGDYKNYFNVMEVK